jgi:hypothetical protein
MVALSSTLTKVVVRYSYDPYWLDQQSQAIDCGTGSCTLPLDRNVGPVYYRLIISTAIRMYSPLLTSKLYDGPGYCAGQI